MFLKGNPDIQGSNLFVEMSTFLKAGDFDENLPSTTDRDFMIRVLDLGDTTYSCIQKHLVHHYADSSVRLSSYGSKAKIIGLTRFLHKYSPRMRRGTVTIQAKSLRPIWMGRKSEIQQKPAKTEQFELPTVKSVHNFHFIIGLTASHTAGLTKLLKDLKESPISSKPYFSCDSRQLGGREFFRTTNQRKQIRIFIS